MPSPQPPVLFSLVALALIVPASPSFGNSFRIATNENCSSCHGNAVVGSTPTAGTTEATAGTLTFLKGGKPVLVSKSGTAILTIRNDSGNQRGGFKGSFPGASAEFSPNTAQAIIGESGYLRAFRTGFTYVVSEARTYTYTPTGRGADQIVVTFTPLSTYFSASGGLTAAQAADAQKKVFKFVGQGVAPQISVIDTKLDAGSVLIGDLVGGTAKLTVRNVGDGNLSAESSTISNLNGSFVAASGTFGGGAPFSLGDNGSQEQVYTFKPGSRGDKTQLVSINATNGSDNGMNQAQTLNRTLTGKGVAPVVSVDSSQASARNVRVGTSSNYILTVHNVGDGNESGLGAVSNLNGTFAAGNPSFSTTGLPGFSIADQSSVAKQYAFAPASRGEVSLNADVVTDNGSSDGGNLAQVLPVQLTGTGVGPKFSSSVAPGSSIDFGSVSAPSSLPLTIFNDTSDPDLGALTMLTLLSFSISGSEASSFSVGSFSAGTQLAKGAEFVLAVDFTGIGAPGLRSATLSLVTDEGAALGGSGSVFEYSLTGNVITAVPEATPAQMLGAGIACIWLLILRKRRAAARAAF